MLYIMINWIKHNIFYLFFIFDYEKKIEIKICSFAKYKFIMKGQGVISFTNLLKKKLGWGGGLILYLLQSSDYFKTYSTIKIQKI